MICHSIKSKSFCMFTCTLYVSDCVQLYLFLVRFFHSGRLKMLLHICWHFKFQTIIPIPFVVALTATAMPTSTAAPLSFIADCSFTRSTSNKTTPTTEVWEERTVAAALPTMWQKPACDKDTLLLLLRSYIHMYIVLLTGTAKKRVKYIRSLRGDLDKVKKTKITAKQICWMLTVHSF